jgi:hypothetical protein
MGGWWAFWVAFVALFAWSVYVDVRHGFDQCLARWWLGRAQEWGPAAGPLSFFFSTLALACFSGLAWAADAVAERAGNPLWALVATTPAMLAYAPFALATAPTQFGGYVDWRRALASAGADARQQRLIAWCAGPASLMGYVALGAALVSAFVS